MVNLNYEMIVYDPKRFYEVANLLEKKGDFKEVINFFLKSAKYYNNYSQIYKFYKENIFDPLYSNDLGRYIEEFKVVFDKDFYRMDILKKKFILFLFFYVPFLENRFDISLFFDSMYEIFLMAKSKNDFELLAYLYQPLLYSYFYDVNRVSNVDYQREFNEKVVKITEKVVAKNFKSKFRNKNIGKNNRIKIGFMIERAIWHSINQVNYSFLKELKKSIDVSRKKIEIVILNLRFFDFGKDFDDIENRFKSIGFEYIDLHKLTVTPDSPFYNIIEKSSKMRTVIRKLNLDILIASPISHFSHIFLFTSRVAKKQIYWSHGNCALDFNGLDARISHFEQICKDFEWNIINVKMDKEILIGSKDEKKKGLELKKDLLSKFGNNTVFIGTIGRLLKLESEEYLRVISEIMNRNPNTVYLACGIGNIENVKSLMKKVGIDLDRVVFPGMVNPHIFGWIIDLWINTYPLPQGNSQEEYHEKGHGIVIQGEVIINCKYDYDFIEKEILKEKPEVFFRAFEVNNIDKNISFNRLMFEVYKKHNKNINEKEILQCIEEIESLQNCKDKWLKTINCISQNKHYREMYRWMTYRLWEEHKKWKNSKNKFIEILKG